MLEKKAVVQKTKQYQFKRTHYVPKYADKLHDSIMTIMESHIYDSMAYQFLNFPHRISISMVYRDKDSIIQDVFHNDFSVKMWDGQFMTAVVYIGKEHWTGGEFWWINDNHQEEFVEVHNNTLVVIPSGLRHRIAPIVGNRKSLNVEFYLK